MNKQLDLSPQAILRRTANAMKRAGKKGFCQKNFGETSDGEAQAPSDERWNECVRLCARGRIFQLYGDFGEAADRLATDYFHEVTGAYISSLNNRCSMTATVKALLKAAKT